MAKFKVVFEIGNTKVTVKREALGYLEALHNAKEEALAIRKKECLNDVTVLSITEI
jgi:hypothetical protein